MCGICGYAGLEPSPELLKSMLDTIIHRGPDDEGILCHDKIGIRMRRLSIIDVSGGHQPIFNEDQTLAIIFNGEIYNYRGLKDDLCRRGHQFRTQSDTETILHSYEEYGVDCVHHLRGMFTFVIFDIPRQRLFVARDRLGVKPLYYWSKNGAFLFGSEIKCLLEYNQLSPTPNLTAIDSYLSFRYVPGPETMFEDIYKLPAGSWMLWEAGQLQIQRYWKQEFHEGDYQDDSYYQERFDELFKEAVDLRLISEVPLGAFLSGGVDSTAIVATMNRLMDNPVQTFTVGFGWKGDELEAVHESTAHLNVNRHEVLCKPEDILLLPKLIWHLDEPVGDAIILPMFLLSKLARQHVTVVLSGEGADETLAGYFPHKVLMWAHHYKRLVPGFLNQPIETGIKAAPLAALNRFFDYPEGLGKRGKKKVLDFLRVVTQHPLPAQYEFLISLFDNHDKASLYSPLLQAHRWQATSSIHANNHTAHLDQVLGWQYDHWLSDDILTKQDKMSMANSIEARVPFLDHKLVEFLWQVPPHLKLSRQGNKLLLRRYINNHLPTNIAKRRKKAFYIPLDQYLQPLQGIIEECLSEKTIKRRGYFQPEHIQVLRDSVRHGDFLYGKQVLALVLLELWHRIFIDRDWKV